MFLKHTALQHQLTLEKVGTKKKQRIAQRQLDMNFTFDLPTDRGSFL